LLNMNLSKSAKKNIFVTSRELSAEELTQVGGAYSASDSGYDSYYDYDSYDYGYEAGGGDYYDYNDSYDPYEYSPADYSSEYDSMIQDAFDANQAWLDANPIQIEIFTIGDFTLSYSGSLTEGLKTAVADCLAAASGSKLGFDFAAVAGAVSILNSNQVGVIGCTLGVGEGIIRDLIP